MNRVAFLLLVCLAASTAIGQSFGEQKRAAYRARMEKLWAIEKRISQTQPARREHPARAENIRDEEVSEIQGVASTVIPGAIVNISTVVTGCPCEEGPWCSDQVWIVAYQTQRTLGLLLSKVENHWHVGVVQRWWLDYEDLEHRRGRFKGIKNYYDAKDALEEEFPTCKAN